MQPLLLFSFLSILSPPKILILPFSHDTVPTKTSLILIYIAAQWDLFSLESCHGNQGIFLKKSNFPLVPSYNPHLFYACSAEVKYKVKQHVKEHLEGQKFPPPNCCVDLVAQ